MDDRINYIIDAENNGVQLRTYDDQPIWLDDDTIWAGILPQFVVTPENNNSGKDIHIKKANRGKFTEAANEHNMGVQEFARQVLSAPKGKYSSTLRKRANFARNFAH